MKADLYFVTCYIFILILIGTLVAIQFMISKDKKPVANKMNKLFASIFIPLLVIALIVITLL